MMKATELRAQGRRRRSRSEVKSLQKAHFGLRMQKATQQLTNTAHAARHAPRHRPRQDHPGPEACAKSAKPSKE